MITDTGNAFDQLLREKISELEADDAEQLAMLVDPVEQMCAAASRVVLAMEGRALQQQGGGQAYVAASTDIPPPEPHALDILH